MATTSTIPVMLTVGQLAKRFNVPLHRIEYVVRSRGIRPTGKAGVAYVYSTRAATRIGKALDETAGDGA